MIELKVNLPEIKNVFKEIAEKPGKIFQMIRYDVSKEVGNYLSLLMKSELTFHLGREKYVRRNLKTKNYRNGSYQRNFTVKGIGQVIIEVPRDRNGTYKSQVLPKSKQYEDAIRNDVSLMFLSGISTRTLSLLSNKLIGRKLSHEEISKSSRQLTEAVEKWRNRDLTEKEKIEYIFMDGVNFDMRVDSKISKVNILAAIGVTSKKERLVLGLQAGDKECAGNWREFFKDLKRRGLDGSQVKLGIMDGLPALEKVFKEEFINAKTQRCQFHVASNVLTKVTKKNKEEIADDMRSIFYASSKKKAINFFEEFKLKWNQDFPSAVKSLENSLESTLTYLSFPEEEWVSLRTTNIIERLNKEFKRRTKPMEILAGENSCYKLLAFISLKMELTWKSSPFGKGGYTKIPAFNKMLKEKEFTQKC